MRMCLYSFPPAEAKRRMPDASPGVCCHNRNPATTCPTLLPPPAPSSHSNLTRPVLCSTKQTVSSACQGRQGVHTQKQTKRPSCQRPSFLLDQRCYWCPLFEVARCTRHLQGPALVQILGPAPTGISLPSHPHTTKHSRMWGLGGVRLPFLGSAALFGLLKRCFHRTGMQLPPFSARPDSATTD